MTKYESIKNAKLYSIFTMSLLMRHFDEHCWALFTHKTINIRMKYKDTFLFLSLPLSPHWPFLSVLAQPFLIMISTILKNTKNHTIVLVKGTTILGHRAFKYIRVCKTLCIISLYTLFVQLLKMGLITKGATDFKSEGEIIHVPRMCVVVTHTAIDNPALCPVYP